MDEQVPSTAVHDSSAAVPRAGQAACRAEGAQLLGAGRSIGVVGTAGMGRADVLHGAVADHLRGRDDTVALRLGLTPFSGCAARVLELTRTLLGAARDRRAGDPVWAELAQQWAADLAGVAGGDLVAAFALLEGMLRDTREQVGMRVLVVHDDLAAWLPADAGSPEERRALEAGLRGLLERPSGPALRLAVGLPPDATRPRGAGSAGLLGAVDRVPLEPLSTEELAERLYAEAPALGAADVAWVARMVGGHPALVRELGRVMGRWTVRRGALDDGARLSLTLTIDPQVREVVEDGIGVLRRMDAGALVDRLFAAAVKAEPAAFGPGDLLLLWPVGLVGPDDRIPERLRVVVARGAVLARPTGRPADEDEGVSEGADVGSESDGGVAADGRDDDDPLADLGRKERLLYNYLRERAGDPIPWKELAAAYFTDDPTMVEDEEKALRSLRAAVNRINAKFAPSGAAAREGWKLVRYARARGFYVDREAVASLGH